MAFHFSLETLLRVRRSLEQQQELRLYAARQKVSAVERQIEETDRQSAALAAATRDNLRQGLSAAELHWRLLCERVLIAQKTHLEADLRVVEEAYQQEQAALRRARHAREVLETLRQHQLEAYELAADQREQRALDEQFLLRRWLEEHGKQAP